MTSNITRQYGVQYVLPEDNRVHTKCAVYVYGEAMHAATAYADAHPDHIVWVESRVVIQESWGETDHAYEEHQQRLRAEERARLADG